jgi:hypothetical protein
MSKVDGLGELHEGILELDPLDATYLIRCLDEQGEQEVIRLQEVFREYVGREVRLTIAFADSLRARARDVTSEVQSNRSEDISGADST